MKTPEEGWTLKISPELAELFTTCQHCEMKREVWVEYNEHRYICDECIARKRKEAASENT